MPENRTKFAFLLLLFAILLSRTDAWSQDHPKELRVYAAPLSFLDPYTGTWQIGVQRFFSPRISLSFDYGGNIKVYGNRHRPHYDRLNYKYSKSRLELKYHFNEHSPVASRKSDFYYLALDALLFPQTYTKENDWVFREEGSFRYDKARIKRTVWVSSFQYGKEVRYNRLVVDKYIGLGIRRLTISQQTTGEREEEFLYYDKHSFGKADREAGTRYRPHLSLGFRVGYVLR